MVGWALTPPSFKSLRRQLFQHEFDSLLEHRFGMFNRFPLSYHLDLGAKTQ